MLDRHGIISYDSGEVPNDLCRPRFRGMSARPRPPVAALGDAPAQYRPLIFQWLAHSFALFKISTHLFSCACALFAKIPGVGGTRRSATRDLPPSARRMAPNSLTILDTSQVTPAPLPASHTMRMHASCSLTLTRRLNDMLPNILIPETNGAARLSVVLPPSAGAEGRKSLPERSWKRPRKSASPWTG